MTTVSTRDLRGDALNWAVATALGRRVVCAPFHPTVAGPAVLDAELVELQADDVVLDYLDWPWGGPLLEKEVDDLQRRGDYFYAYRSSLRPGATSSGMASGTSILEAACRCFVLAKLGETVNIPKEILP